MNNKPSFYERFVLSFVSAGMAIIQSFALYDENFRKQYQSILKKIIETADLLRPYYEEQSETGKTESE